MCALIKVTPGAIGKICEELRQQDGEQTRRMATTLRANDLEVSILLDHIRKDISLWTNSSLGLLIHWWRANKQQAGRGSIGVSALESLPVIDVTKLSPETLQSSCHFR